jgi:tetratricopeptide (TPR) repeat protein
MVTQQIVGTPAYMSPEQARGEPADARSDLFSLGCILYECLVGEKPFQGNGAEGILAQILSPDPPPTVDWKRIGLPAELDEVLHRVLAKTPSKRFSSGAELIEALQAVPANGAHPSAVSVGETSPPPRAEAEEPPQPLDPEKLKQLQEEERPLHLSATISDDLQAARLSSEEGFMLSRVDGTSKPRDILALSPLDEEQTARTLLGLLERGLIRLDEAPPKQEKSRKTKAKEEEALRKQRAAQEALLQEVESLLQAASEGDKPAVLGVRADTGLEEVRKSYRERVLRFHPDRHPQISDPGIRQKLSDLLAAASEAFSVLSQKAEQRESEATIRATHPSFGSTDVSSTEGSDVYDNAQHCRELHVHAQKAYDVQDFWQTIQLCRQAIEVCNNKPKVHYLLALALLRNKKWRKEAAQSLRTAVDLDPENLEYLGTLGAVYQAEGLRTRAKKVFEQVKSIDPSYEIPELPS